jgi:hypothetical protein
MRNKLMAAVALAAVLAGGKPADAALMTYTATRLLNARMSRAGWQRVAV